MNALAFSEVEIDGFRGLRSLKLEGLGRITILVGRNNSGKTSVLEALSILCQPENPSEWLAMVRRRDQGRLDETIVQSLRWCFSQTDTLVDPEVLIDASCHFKCNGHFPLRKLDVFYRELMGLPSPEELPLSSRRLGNDINTIEPLHGAELTHHYWGVNEQQLNLFSDPEKTLTKDKSIRIFENTFSRYPLSINRLKSDYVLDSETLSPYSYQLNKSLIRAQSKQIFNDDVLALLKEFDADIEGISIASFSGYRPAIYIKHCQLGVAPLSVFGDAMRRAVLLADTLLSLKTGGLLLIDEVEVGIHVSALANVFNWLVSMARKLDIQIVLTTHSLEALDAIISCHSVQTHDDIVAFHITQTEEGTLSKRFSGDFLNRLRFERGLDLR